MYPSQIQMVMHILVWLVEVNQISSHWIRNYTRKPWLSITAKILTLERKAHCWTVITEDIRSRDSFNEKMKLNLLSLWPFYVPVIILPHRAFILLASCPDNLLHTLIYTYTHTHTLAHTYTHTHTELPWSCLTAINISVHLFKHNSFRIS